MSTHHIALCLLLVTGCGKDRISDKSPIQNQFDSNVASVDSVRADSLDQQLQRAFAMRSQVLLDRFIKSWEDDTTFNPITPEHCVSDTLRAIYGIFQAFADSLYRDAGPVVALPYGMRFSIFEPMDKNEAWVGAVPRKTLYEGSVRKFCPRYSNNHAHVLYLDGVHELALDRFLRPLSPKGKSRKESNQLELLRFNFLSKRLSVMLTHWGDNYIFVSQPEIERIELSTDLTHAIVHYAKTSYYGSSALYQRTFAGWRYTRNGGSSILFWVQ